MPGLATLLLIGLVLAVVFSAWAAAHRLRRPPRKTYASAVARGRPGDPSELPNPRAFEAYTLNLRGAPQGTPVWDIAGDDPNGPIVIFTPGWGDSKLGVIPRLRGLAPHAARVLAWDPPGAGEATGLCAMGTREDRILRELIEHARTSYPRHAIVLYGSSLGGGASIVCAASEDCPACVVGVAAEGAYRLPWVPARNVIRMTDLPWTFNGPIAFACLSLRLGAGWMFSRAHDGQGFDRVKHAARVRVPLLVIHGGSDEVCPVADAHALHQAARDSQLVVVENAGHNDLWTDERFAGGVAHAVSGFVGRVGVSW